MFSKLFMFIFNSISVCGEGGGLVMPDRNFIKQISTKKMPSRNFAPHLPRKPLLENQDPYKLSQLTHLFFHVACKHQFVRN